MMDTPLLALTRGPSSPFDMRSPESTTTANMGQLVQLRWIAVAGQLATIAIVHFVLGVPLPVLTMLGIVAILAAANVVVTLVLHRYRITNGLILLALLFDVGVLSVQLYLSGGATNPFISLYLLQVVLGAILLEVWSVWLLVAVTGLCFALLSFDHLPLTYPPPLLPWVGDLYTVASWLSFVLIAVLLILFVTRITRNLRLRDAYLAEMRQRSIEEDGIVRMGLFASGAAHELGTPLSTLSVILGDWRRVPKIAGDAQLLAELGEMQEEVQRCKTIVSDILRSAGQPRGEELASTPVDGLLAGILADWQALHPGTALEFRRKDTEGTAVVADPALRQAIWNLLDNAAEASPGWVALDAVRRDRELVLAVRDRGPGFDEAALDDLGRPHASRKGPGHGVGLFLVWNVMRRLEGRAEAHNLDGGGAQVRLHLPLAADQHRKSVNVGS
jgi:two-component system sensor histidine kinase RegB